MTNIYNDAVESDMEPSPDMVRHLSARIIRLELLLAEMLLKNQQLRFSLGQQTSDSPPGPMI